MLFGPTAVSWELMEYKSSSIVKSWFYVIFAVPAPTWKLGRQFSIDDSFQLSLLGGLQFFSFVVIRLPWYLICCICDPLPLPFIYLIKSQTSFVGVLDVWLGPHLLQLFLFGPHLLQLFLFVSLMILHAWAWHIFSLVRFIKQSLCFFQASIAFLQA